MNTATYKYFIDFAARYGLEYILLDEGWSVSTLNIREPRKEVDLKEIVRYGNEKGVGVILWTLWNPMKKDLTGILDTYRDWGVKGIKIDFMQRSDQEMVNFYEQIARAAYDRGLLVDFHGSFKPAGLQRKYPNVLSFEGVYGMENDKCSKDITPAHDCVLPFTRMVAGPMDYTPGATVNATAADFSVSWSHPMSQGTRAHQAALYVIYESPLQMLCDSPSHYLRTPEFTASSPPCPPSGTRPRRCTPRPANTPPWHAATATGGTSAPSPTGRAATWRSTSRSWAKAATACSTSPTA